MPERTRLLILGLGNVLCGDDGIGIAAIERLLALWEPPEGVLVLDGGTLGLSLLPYLEDAERVILVDAVADQAPAGSFVRLEGEEVGPAVAARLSPHQIGVADLLDAARWLGRYPSRVVLVGLVPATLALGLGCSPSVARSFPDLVSRIVEEARALGFSFRPRKEDALPPGDSFRDGVAALGL